MKKTLISIFVTLMLCGTLVWITTVGADTALSIKNKGYVTVKGFAKKQITSDLGIFEATFLTEDPVMELGYQKLAKDRQTVRAFLEKYKIPDDDMALSATSVTEQYKINERGHRTDEFVKFKFDQSLKVESSDVKKNQKAGHRDGGYPE